MNNYFEKCTTIEEVKAEYKKLVFQYHPDITGIDTTEIMAEINNQYEETSQRLKNIHKNMSGATYKRETTDTSEEFRDIINNLIHFRNVYIEVCGDWLWVSGNTKEYKEILKSLNFRWSPNKEAWYFHTQKYHKRSKELKTFQEIRKMFGSQRIVQEDVGHVKALKKTFRNI